MGLLGVVSFLSCERATKRCIGGGKNGQTYISIEEVSAACPKVSQAHIEALKRLGALGEMPESSQINLFEGF